MDKRTKRLNNNLQRL